MLKTLSVEQAIHVVSSSGPLGSGLEARIGMSWMPTLKRGRGRELGRPPGGSKGRMELGSEASKDRSYTISCQCVRKYFIKGGGVHTIVTRYMNRCFDHQQNPLAQQRSSVERKDKRSKRVEQMRE